MQQRHQLRQILLVLERRNPIQIGFERSGPARVDCLLIHAGEVEVADLLLESRCVRACPPTRLQHLSAAPSGCDPAAHRSGHSAPDPRAADSRPSSHRRRICRSSRTGPRNDRAKRCQSPDKAVRLAKPVARTAPKHEARLRRNAYSHGRRDAPGVFGPGAKSVPVVRQVRQAIPSVNKRSAPIGKPKAGSTIQLKHATDQDREVPILRDRSSRRTGHIRSSSCGR